jgi:hypothetical protein
MSPFLSLASLGLHVTILSLSLLILFETCTDMYAETKIFQIDVDLEVPINLLQMEKILENADMG